MEKYAVFTRTSIKGQKNLGYYSFGEAYALFRILSETFNILSVYKITDKSWARHYFN